MLLTALFRRLFHTCNKGHQSTANIYYTQTHFKTGKKWATVTNPVWQLSMETWVAWTPNASAWAWTRPTSTTNQKFRELS